MPHLHDDLRPTLFSQFALQIISAAIRFVEVGGTVRYGQNLCLFDHVIPHWLICVPDLFCQEARDGMVARLVAGRQQLLTHACQCACAVFGGTCFLGIYQPQLSPIPLHTSILARVFPWSNPCVLLRKAFCACCRHCQCSLACTPVSNLPLRR